jgi:hypothetical protein
MFIFTVHDVLDSTVQIAKYRIDLSLGFLVQLDGFLDCLVHVPLGCQLVMPHSHLFEALLTLRASEELPRRILARTICREYPVWSTHSSTEIAL